MSDNWIAVIPENPEHIPSAECQNQALSFFWSIAPEADEIEIRLSDHLMFFDCGANLESISCPNCGKGIPIDWWQDRMGEDYEFTSLKSHALPCCEKLSTLAELEYDWPQGFAKFGIDAMNPKIGILSDEEKGKFEEILGTPLRIIYQHI